MKLLSALSFAHSRLPLLCPRLGPPCFLRNHTSLCLLALLILRSFWGPPSRPPGRSSASAGASTALICIVPPPGALHSMASTCFTALLHRSFYVPPPGALHRSTDLRATGLILVKAHCRRPSTLDCCSYEQFRHVCWLPTPLFMLTVAPPPTFAAAGFSCTVHDPTFHHPLKEEHARFHCPPLRVILLLFSAS